jgi:hypothetical protein
MILDFLHRVSLLLNLGAGLFYFNKGDNSMGVGIMIEILRNIINQNDVLKNPIIFLFNTGEELGLWGSYHFMLSHRWTKNVKRFINVDSMAGSGKEIMLRCNPSSISKEYTNVPYPQANVIILLSIGNWRGYITIYSKRNRLLNVYKFYIWKR